MTNVTKRILSAIMSLTVILSLFAVPSVKAADIPGWIPSYVGGAEGSVEIDKDTFYSGDGAMKIVNTTPRASNVYMVVETEIPLQKGKKYNISAQVKSKRSTVVQFVIDWEKRYSLTPFSTYDWMNFEFTYTAAGSQTSKFKILTEGTTQGVWLDDIKFIDVETGENLIKNSNFDTAGAGNISSGNVSDGSLEGIYNLIRSSETFSEKDMISVRGAFKYMPVYNADGIKIDGDASDWENYPEMSMPTLPTQYQVYMNDGRARDVEAKCRFAKDKDNFYMIIEVTDDKFVYAAGENDYWKGDSIQLAFSGLDEVYGSELGFAHNPETGMGEIYGSGFTTEQKKRMSLATSQQGDKTVYEAKIPWNVKFDKMPESLLFDFLVNDNDGDGRRYCVELAPGISEGKSNAVFPLLEILDSQKDWYGWVQGSRNGQTETECKFEYYLVNSGEEKTFNVENLVDGTTEEIVVPAQSGIRREINHVFDTPGTYPIEVKFSTGEDEFLSVAEIDIDRKPPDEKKAKQIAENMKKQADELLKLIEQCTVSGISTDYEKVSYNIIERFAGYVEDDIANNDLSRVYYTEETTSELYNRAKADLEAYLSGEKTPKAVPKYVTGDMRIDGTAAYAKMDIDGVTEERPVFFVGYGHFDQARKDIPVFNDWGVNTIQNEIGPSHVMVNSSGWQKIAANNPNGNLEIVTDVVKAGSSALKLTYNSGVAANQYLSVFQNVKVLPGKTYELKGSVKADKAGGVWISPNNFDDRNQLAGNYDWKEFSCEYTVPSGKTDTTIRILIENLAGAVYFDDITFCEKGTSYNLLKDGGFESFGRISSWEFNEEAPRLQTLLQTLQDAEDNNIAVSVLVSPHYFPGEIIDQFGIGVTNGFLKYNVNAPEAREFIETYLRNLIPIIKDYKSLNNICISNEPQFQVSGCGDFYLEDWHNYLKDIYKDIAKLNEAYNTDYQSFDEVDFNANFQNPAKYYDYKIFNDEVFASWHRWMAEIIHELAPDIPLHTKIMGYVCDDTTRSGFSNNGTGYQKYYDFLDLNGCDYWNYIDDSHMPLVKEMYYDYLCSLKNVPVINSEDHIISDRNQNFSKEVGDYVSQDIYQGAIHGRYMSDIWVWERTYDHKSDFWGSILFRPDAIAKISKATLDLNRLSYEITALQNEVPEIGIIYSESGILNNENSMHAAYEAYIAAMFNGKRVKFIADSQPQKMNDCKLVVVPNTTNAPAETLKALKNYIQNGGRVLIMGENMLSKNERNFDNDKELVNFIQNNSTVIPYEGSGNRMISPADTEFRALFREILKELGIYYVSVVDAENGEPVDNVEYNIGVYDGKVVVNMVNFSEDMNVKVYIGDKLVSGAENLIDGGVFDETIALKQYVPVTFKTEADNLFFDTYGHWAENDIKELSGRKIVSGVSESRFAPDRKITRAEFLALLVRTAGDGKTEYKESIPDVEKEDWFFKDVVSALNMGIIEDNAKFRPNDRITREEMCEMLVKCYEKQNGRITGFETAEFKDSEKIADKEAVSKAVQLKLMYGRDDGTFAPSDFATRAEASAVIVRLTE